MGLFGSKSSHYRDFPSSPANQDSGYLGPSSKKKKKAEKKLPNPNPANFIVVQYAEVGAYLVLKINYPDCTNYEGNKILVYKDLTVLQLLNLKVIDPHFFGDKKHVSPIARFVPTEEGWQMATGFAKMMIGKQKT